MSTADLPRLIAAATAYSAFRGVVPEHDPGARALAEAVAALTTRGTRPQPLAVYLDHRTGVPSVPFAESLTALQEIAPPPQTVIGSGGPVRASDLIAWTRAEIAAAWLATGDEPPSEIVVAAARTIAHVLTARHPGRSVEVRVPPAVAVQIGFGHGPTHSRGTPPNVVETNPATLVRLAAGALSWADAVATGAVRASGDAADIGPAFPLCRVTGN